MNKDINKDKAKNLISLKGRLSLEFDWKAEEEKELKAQALREKMFIKKRHKEKN